MTHVKIANDTRHILLLSKVAGGEGKGEAEGLMPVFPIVNAVANAEFVVNPCPTHQLMHLDALVKEEIVIATIEEPLDGTKFRLSLFVGLLYETKCAMLLHSLANIVAFVLLTTRAYAVTLIIEPRTHGVAGREHIGMPLTIDCTAAATHGKPHHGSVLFVAYNLIFLLDSRQELLEKEVLVVPARHIKVAVPSVVRVRTTCIWHKNHDGNALARAYQFVDNSLHLTSVSPSTIVVAETMQEVDGWIALGFIFAESIGQIDIQDHVGGEDLALHRIGYNPTCRQGQTEQKQQGCKYCFLHNLLLQNAVLYFRTFFPPKI